MFSTLAEVCAYAATEEKAASSVGALAAATGILSSEGQSS